MLPKQNSQNWGAREYDGKLHFERRPNVEVAGIPIIAFAHGNVVCPDCTDRDYYEAKRKDRVERGLSPSSYLDMPEHQHRQDYGVDVGEQAQYGAGDSEFLDVDTRNSLVVAPPGGK